MYIQQAKITMNHADGTFWHRDNDWNAPPALKYGPTKGTPAMKTVGASTKM